MLYSLFFIKIECLILAWQIKNGSVVIKTYSIRL